MGTTKKKNKMTRAIKTAFVDRRANDKYMKYFMDVSIKITAMIMNAKINIFLSRMP